MRSAKIVTAEGIFFLTKNLFNGSNKKKRKYDIIRGMNICCNSLSTMKIITSPITLIKNLIAGSANTFFIFSVSFSSNLSQISINYSLFLKNVQENILLKLEEIVKSKTILLSVMITIFGLKLFAQKSYVTHVNWSKDAVIYEVNIRQYTEEGTFDAFSEHLPRLKEMGIDILWLMPIHPIGELNRKGTLGSYYSVKDFKAVNPEFGTMEDFKSLVDKAHSMGMYVIIDWVANHAAWDNVLVETNPEFFTTDSLGNFVPPVPDWSDVIDFNYDNKELWDYMIGALKFWVEQANIDGYRCDVAGMVPIEFWNKVRKELDEIKPVFMLAEWETPEMHEYAFDMTYAWDFHHLMNDIAQGEKTVKDIDAYWKQEKKEYPANAYRMMFTSNHDENSWNGTVFERMGDAAEAMLVLSATVEGMPLVYSGQEAGLNKRLDFFEKDLIEWKEHKFYELYKKLFELKKHNKALWNGEFGGEINRVKNGNDKNVYSFSREKDGDKIFVIINLSNKSQTVKLNNRSLVGKYKNIFTDKEIMINGSDEFNLEPWSYMVLSHTN